MTSSYPLPQDDMLHSAETENKGMVLVMIFEQLEHQT
jgi:hypothetical protein